MPAPVASPWPGGTHHGSILTDHCWSLPLLAACANFLFSMPGSNSGLFYALFMDKFGVNREAASWSSTITTVMSSLMGFGIGAIQEKVSIDSMMLTGAVLCPVAIISSAFVPSIQLMMVTFGFFYGITDGILMITISVYMVSYFEKYRSVAVGLKFLGLSASGIIGSFLLSALEEEYGLEGAILVLGGLNLNLMPLILLLQRPSPTRWPLWKSLKKGARNGEEPTKTASNHAECAAVQRLKQSEKEQQFRGNNSTNSTSTITQPATTTKYESDKHQVTLPPRQAADHSLNDEDDEATVGVYFRAAKVLRTPIFYALVVPFIAAEFTMSLLASTIVDYAIDKEVPMDSATMLVTCIGIGGLFGRLVIPVLAGKVPHGRCVVASVCFLLVSLCLVLMPILKSFVVIAVVTTAAGLQLSYLGTIKAVLVADNLGVRSVPVSWGLIALVSLPVTFCQPSIIGLFRDTGGSYDNLYRLCSAMDLIAALVLFLVPFIQIRRGSKSS